MIDDNRAIHEDFRKILLTVSKTSDDLDAPEAELFGQTTVDLKPPVFEIDSAYQGQEGLELGFDQLLNGEDGAKRVIRDSHGNYVEAVDSIRAPRQGRDLVTSIDLRIQYLAYRELKSAMQEYRAHAGSVTVIDVDTGEVLAMVNQPAYNPNDREQLKPGLYRNRAATDIFEPGSSIKPFVIDRKSVV